MEITIPGTLLIGWAQTDITPQQQPVYLSGQFYARVSEGVADPLSATVLVLANQNTHVVFVSMDTISIPENLRTAVRTRVRIPGLDPNRIILNATHTHEAPLNRVAADGICEGWVPEEPELSLGVSPPEIYVEFAADQIAEAVTRAWQQKQPGGIAYGQDMAVVGRNRRWIDLQGGAHMYGLDSSNADAFSHIEGYEDHSLNLLATYDENRALTGLVVNVPSPSQETEHLFQISADFWCETRQEIRARWGEEIFILPQCSAAGDLTPHLIYENAAHDRMMTLKGHSNRQEIALRITDAVGRVLPYLTSTIDFAPQLEYRQQILELPLNNLTAAHVQEAQIGVQESQAYYEAVKAQLLANPELRNETRWYTSVTTAFNRAKWYQSVEYIYEAQKTCPTRGTEVHLVRLGDIAFAFNEFEYYLDYGIQIKVKSPALQTFLVQLAGNGTYVPSPRAAAGGAYGAVAAGNPVGPEGGLLLADYSVEQLRQMWDTSK